MEIRSVELVPVVEELSLGIVVRSHTLVSVADTESVTVEHYTKNTANVHVSAACGLDVDGRGVGKTVVLT